MTLRAEDAIDEFSEEALPTTLPHRSDRGGFSLRRRDVMSVIALGLLQAGVLVAFTLTVRRVIDALVPTGVGRAAEAGYQNALWLCLVLAGCAIVLGIARAVEFTVAESAGYRVVRRLRMDMYAHLQRMRPADLHHRARGGLLLRLTGDLSMLRMWLSRGLLEGMSAAIVLVIGLGVLWWFDPWMALAAVSVFGFGAAVSLMSGRAMREATRTMRRRRSLLMGNIDEQINTMRVSQVSGRTNGEYARLDRQNDALTDALLRVAGLRGRLRGISTGTATLAVVAVLVVGVVEVQRLQTSVGAVVAAVLITRLLSRPVRTLGLSHDYWHRGLVSRQKIVEFLSSSARSPQHEQLPALTVRGGRVEFDNVSVTGVLAGFTATAERGELVALTGPSGSGKTTLLNMLARLVDPDSGRVMIDDQMLAHTAPSSVGRMMGMAGPDMPLLRGTILRNVTYAARGAAPGEVQRVVQALGLDESLAASGREDLNSWVTEGGANLSSSDRQLVSLARAMMGTPRVLLLDEPFTGLDDAARSRAREAILRHRGTVFLVTQDSDALALADRVWVMAPEAPVTVLTGAEYRDRQWRMRDERSLRW